MVFPAFESCTHLRLRVGLAAVLIMVVDRQLTRIGILVKCRLVAMAHQLVGHRATGRPIADIADGIVKILLR